MKIDGDKVIVSSPEVKAPRGVSYATGGVGFQPNLYNKALLPMTPFIYYDNKLVTSKDWPDDPIKIAGVKPDPNAGGLLDEYRKMPLLSTQFRDNAVLQADTPITFWGSAIHDWGYEAKGKAVIKFSFNGIEKDHPGDARHARVAGGRARHAGQRRAENAQSDLRDRWRSWPASMLRRTSSSAMSGMWPHPPRFQKSRPRKNPALRCG